MFAEAYKDIIADDQGGKKSDEREVLSRTISLMKASDKAPQDLMLRIKTVHLVSDVWTFFVNDLASEDNTMTDELKASLLSIGIFILKYVQKMRSDKALHFTPLITISNTIMEGLEQ